MIVPTKVVKPNDSLGYIASEVIKQHGKGPLSVDDIWILVNKNSKISISMKKVILSINFLYMIDKIERENEVISIKL